MANPQQPVANPQPACILKGLGAALPDGRPLFRELWLSLPAGARLAVVGPRAAGKTTLLRIMAGEASDYEGEARAADSITLGYLPPEPYIDDAETVAGAVEASVSHLRRLLKQYDAVMAELAAGPIDYGPPLEAQGRLEQALNAAGAWRLDRRMASLTAALRLPPDASALAALTPAERRRVALCRLLLRAPDLLLLDEPHADLDAEAAAWLDGHLAAYPGTVVAATRDRCFLDGVADWMLELDAGTSAAWQGGYASWLERKREQLDGAAAPAGERRLAVQREMEWLQLAPRVRTADARARMRERAGARAGSAAVEAENLVKGSGARTLLRGLSFALPPGAIAGVLGPGRCGKTTLLRLLAGAVTPDAGQIRLGPDIRAALLAGPDGGPCPDPAARLAAQQQAGVNLVLLDEPERSLDIDGLRALEEALLAFPGTLVVGHGRPPPARPHRHPHPGLRGAAAARPGSPAPTRPTRPTAGAAGECRPRRPAALRRPCSRQSDACVTVK